MALVQKGNKAMARKLKIHGKIKALHSIKGEDRIVIDEVDLKDAAFGQLKKFKNYREDLIIEITEVQEKLPGTEE